MKLLVKSELFEVEVEGETVKEVWEKAAFWHSLPTTCPVDQTPVRFGYSKNSEGNEFYFLESTGKERYEFHFGTKKDGKTLFPGKVRGEGQDKAAVQEWTYYDPQKRVAVAKWRDGQLLTSPTPSQQASEAPVEHRKITSDADIDKLMDEAAPMADGPDPWEMAYKVCDDLGLSIYNAKWTNRFKEAAAWASNKRTSNPQELTIDELNKIATPMRKHLSNGVHVGVTA